jgi:hypothetical protein
MRKDSFDCPGPSGDTENDQGYSVEYRMRNPYDPERLMRWLINFDDVQHDGEEAILPYSSLPKVPPPTQILQRPKEFHDIILSDKSYVSQEMLKRLEVDEDSKTLEDWLPKWGTELRKIKKRLHRSNLLKDGIKPTTQQIARPTTYRTKKAKVFRALIASELFSSRSIEAFTKLSVMQRLAKYRDTLEAPGMINIPDPAVINANLLTHCVASISNQNARTFLDAPALMALPPNCQEVWREGQRHFWRNNVFVVDATNIKAVLNGFNARIKSYIGVLHIDLEALDDLDNLASPSHINKTNSQSLRVIRQQNQDLRRIMQECYDLTWVRVHVHTEWTEGEIYDLAQAHRSCKASPQNKQCRHVRRYQELCMNTQRRVEHLTWLFYKSLKCKEGTVFIDVEQLGLDGITRIFEVQIDHKKLGEVDKKMRAAWKEQREHKTRGGRKVSHASRVHVVKRAKIEVIDLT